MIVDTLDRISDYFGLSKEMDTALAVLKHYDMSLLYSGDYKDFPVDGCEVLLKLKDPDNFDEQDYVPWECHNKVIDIHCVLNGAEIIAYAPAGKIEGWRYDPNTDTSFSDCDCDYLPIKLEKGYFAVFFPQDAHRKIAGAGNENYRKIVLKVPVKKKSIAE